MFGLGFLGKLGALASSVARAWSPLALWPDGIDSPGMWISPRDLTSQWQDYTGTTPVVTPGTVADSANPVGLAYDLRVGTPVLGPELVVNGDFSDGTTGWSAVNSATISTVGGELQVVSGAAGYPGASQVITWTEGHTYEVTATARQGTTTDTVRIVLPSVVELGYTSSSPVAKSAIVVAVGSSVTAYCEIFNPFDITPGETAYFDNISVREVPGLHMLQSTSAARPLLSARVNLLTYTEDFSNAAWAKADVSITPNSITSPDNGVTASKVTSSGSVTTAYVVQLIQNVALFSHSFYAKAGTSNFACFTTNTNACYANFNISTGSVASYSNCTAAISAVGDGWYRCSITEPANGIYFMILGKDADPGAQPYGTGVWASGNYIYLWGPQLQYGPSVVTPYQSVPGNGSTYPSTGFPIAQKYDGVDDGMATAAFSAGTLIDGMDCLIAVRRDSAAKMFCGLNSAGYYFGNAESGWGVACFVGCGTPTVWVDGVQLAGGTAVTADTLNTALTVGDYHILEFRDLTLSTWTSLQFGVPPYPGYAFNGPRGDILLYPSTASTEDKDAARQYLADYYGVTLP